MYLPVQFVAVKVTFNVLSIKKLNLHEVYSHAQHKTVAMFCS